MSDIFNYFSPAYWGVSSVMYEHWWYYLLGHVFFGFIPKMLAFSLLMLSFFSLITRQFRPGFAVLLFLLAVFLTYFGTLLRWLV